MSDMKFTTAEEMMKDYVYYAMVAEDDGTLRFPSCTSAMDCFSTPEEAIEFARQRGYNEVEVVQWQVD